MSGDYAIGLMTIITGLAISDVVASLHNLLMNRARVHWDWLAIWAVLFIVLMIVAIWGISYRAMGNQQFDPPLWVFAIRLAQIVPMYLAARASLPDALGEGLVSLASHYAEISRYFWASIAITVGIYLGFNIASGGVASLLGANLSPTAQLLMMLVLIAVSQRRVHALLVPAIILLFCHDHLNHTMFS